MTADFKIAGLSKPNSFTLLDDTNDIFSAKGALIEGAFTKLFEWAKEDLSRGNKIHWCHPSRFVLID